MAWVIISDLCSIHFLFKLSIWLKTFNPISGRLLATPISGRGLFRTPLDISRSNGLIFKIQTAFDSTQRDLHLLKNKKNLENINRGYQGEINGNFQIHFRLLNTAKFLNQF